MAAPGPAFLSQQEQYELHNYQNEEDLAALTRLLETPAGTRTPVILLAGETGIGRRYLLEAALHRAKKVRRTLRDSRLDLSKFNPDDPRPVQQFAERCLANCTGDAHPRASEIVRLLSRRFEPKLTTDLVTSGLIGIALEIGLSLTDLFLIYGETFERIPAASASPRESLHLFLKPLTTDSRLVLHMPFGGTLEEPLRDVLVNEWKSNPNLTLVFSCHGYHNNEDIALTDQVRRFEVHPLDQGELRRALERQFATRDLRDLADSLMKYSHGRAGLVARAMRGLIDGGAAVWEGPGGWRFSSEGLDHAALPEVFLDLYEPVSRRWKELPSRQRGAVERWLWMAALCEDWFPVKLLLGAIGVAEDDEDDWIDVLDEFGGVESEKGLLEDLGYNDPRWPGELLYRFRDPVTAAVLRQHITDDREKLSARLVGHLEPRMPWNSREAAGLLLRAARFDEVSRERLEKRFRYWIGADAAEELARVLREAVAKGREDPNQLLAAALHAEDREPPYRVLAVANALVDGEAMAVGVDRAAALESLRGRLLFASGEYREAELLFGSALDGEIRRDGIASALLGSLPVWLARTWFHLGPESTLTFEEGNAVHPVRAARGGEGYLVAAEKLLQRALAIREGASGEHDLSLGVVLHEMAQVKRAQSHYGEAERLLTRALQVFENRLGADHPEVAYTLHEIARVKHAQGRYGEEEEEEELFTRALRIKEARLGPDHPDVATTLHEMARVKYDQSHSGEAEKLLIRALRIKEAHLGADHPDVATTLHEMARVKHAQGDRGEAEKLLTRALQIKEAHLGADHPDVAATLHEMGRMKYAQGDYGKAEELLNRARQIFETDRGADHPDVAYTLHQMGGVKHAQGHGGEAERLLTRALEIRRKSLPADHPLIGATEDDLRAIMEME